MNIRMLGALLLTAALLCTGAQAEDKLDLSQFEGGEPPAAQE